MEFGELVTYLRRKAKLTQDDLAKKAKISIQYLNQIEKGRALESIGDQVITKISTALDITADQFNKIKSNALNYSNENNVSDSTIKELEKEIETRSQIESMLRDVIKRQDERISELSEQVKFLKSLLEKKHESI